MKINGNEIRPGNTILHQDTLWRAVKAEAVKPGSADGWKTAPTVKVSAVSTSRSGLPPKRPSIWPFGCRSVPTAVEGTPVASQVAISSAVAVAGSNDPKPVEHGSDAPQRLHGRAEPVP